MFRLKWRGTTVIKGELVPPKEDDTSMGKGYKPFKIVNLYARAAVTRWECYDAEKHLPGKIVPWLMKNAYPIKAIAKKDTIIVDPEPTRKSILRWFSKSKKDKIFYDRRRWNFLSGLM